MLRVTNFTSKYFLFYVKKKLKYIEIYNFILFYFVLDLIIKFFFKNILLVFHR